MYKWPGSLECTALFSTVCHFSAFKPKNPNNLNELNYKN